MLYWIADCSTSPDTSSGVVLSFSPSCDTSETLLSAVKSAVTERSISVWSSIVVEDKDDEDDGGGDCFAGTLKEGCSCVAVSEVVSFSLSARAIIGLLSVLVVLSGILSLCIVRNNQVHFETIPCFSTFRRALDFRLGLLAFLSDCGVVCHSGNVSCSPTHLFALLCRIIGLDILG